MIVPQPRLLVWCALLGVPFTVLAALQPDSAALAAVVLAAFVALVLLDAAWSAMLLGGVRVELPAVVRLSQSRPGALALKVHQGRPRPLRLRIGLPLPAPLGARFEETDLLVPATESASCAWPIVPRQRGKYRIREAFLETASRLGFWGQRRSLPVSCEVRVYPNLMSERRRLAALFLHRGGLGAHAQRQVGKGRDFEKLREYVPGDSYDEVHWKATAKRGHPVTKVFQIERTQEIYVIVDASRLSARPAPRTAPAPGEEESGPPPTTLERFITSAMILGLAAEQQGDLFGLLTFSDRVETFVRARNGRAHYSVCRDALYTLPARDVSPDFDEVASFIRLRLRRRALLLFLTSLDDPVLAESFTRNMGWLSRQHLVLVNTLQSPGIQPIFSQPQVERLDEIYAALSGHLRWQSLRELEKVLQRRGVAFHQLANECMSSELVAQYLNVKQRQLL